MTLRTSCRPVTGQHTADTYQAFAPSLRQPHTTDEPIDIMRFQPSLLAFSDGAYSRPRHHIYVCTASVLDSFFESGPCPAVFDYVSLRLRSRRISHWPRILATPAACTKHTQFALASPSGRAISLHAAHSSYRSAPVVF